MGWAQEQTLENALRTSFRARRAARGEWCARCPIGRRAECWHHFLPQQAIRVYMREAARREGLEPPAVRRRLKRLLADERNLVALCHEHHRELEAWMDGGSGRASWRPPAAAVEFARELGPEWLARLERAYPGLRS